MDQQLRFEQEEETIDLKQLFCYLMRKWKVILVLLMVGVLIGAGFGMYKGKNVLQYDAQKAEQFAAYQKSKDNYQQQLNRNAQSVLQQMSPGSVYSSERVFKLSTQEQADEICGRYHAIFEDGATLRELALASFLNCTEEAVAELINVSIEKDFEEQARLQVTVLAPTEESRAALVNALDEKFAALTAELKLTDPSHGFRLVSEERHYGYVEEVFLAQLSASKALEYGKELVKQTEGALAEEERAYSAILRLRLPQR